MNLPYSEELNINYLGRLFDNTSECYKFFWFKAIVKKVIDDQLDISYDELVDEMIVDAFYMVSEFYLNLGPNDTLEKIVHRIREINSELKPNSKKRDIYEFLKQTEDKQVLKLKKTLTLNVPYRLQAPFFPDMKGDAWKNGQTKLIERINNYNHLIYYFDSLAGLKTIIHVQEDWARYIKNNQEIIQGWLEYNMIIYLQKRNPSVPGISDKLYPPMERKLQKIKKFWDMILAFNPVKDIYSEKALTEKNISIDHFVPWSYVAHDEMWNLNPTFKEINSSKSNNLPDWDIYFKRLADQEFYVYQMIWKYDQIHYAFEKCSREYINNDDVRFKLYRDGLNQNEFSNELESILLPVYQSAKNCGFG
ncbi:MAG: HNH endonuclease, partial [Lachnospiraceae bacterium]|nr:HNH endonuclease [Lachnospiraceae bacterium]